MTHANSNRTASLNDAYSQHVGHLSPRSTSGVCFFDGPKWFLAGAKCLCHFSRFWNEEMNGGGAAHSLHSARRVGGWPCFPPTRDRRALNSIVILLLCSSRERRHCFAHYDEPIHSVRFFVLPRNPRHAWAIAVGRPCLSPACVDSRDLYPVELRASGKKKPNKKKQQSILHRRGGDREQETLCHCRVRDYKLNCAAPGDTSAQKLPASDVAQERSAEQERRMWRGKESPASSTINLSVCVCVSQKNVAFLIWLLLRLSVGGPIRLRCVCIDHFHAIPVHTIFFFVPNYAQ